METELSQPQLPNLHDATLDSEMVAALLRDITACTEFIEAIPKHSANGKVNNGGLRLDEVPGLLADPTVRAIQLRYRYEQAEWWDTLLRLPTGFRLVRIRHNFND